MKKSYAVTVVTSDDLEILPCHIEYALLRNLHSGVESVKVSTGVKVIVELDEGLFNGVRVIADNEQAEKAYGELCDEHDITPGNNYNDADDYQAIFEGAELE